ncbi:MAG: hypothetical protein KGK00_17380 [Paracoccaceae bacterium]|nr:hypothetical protein [Paracoccaceae bacterium]
MEELQEFERRIALALDRIAAGIEALDGLDAPQPVLAGGAADGDTGAAASDVARLTDELTAEREAYAQLGALQKSLREKLAAAQSEVDELTRQVDRQALEIQRLKAQNVALRETGRAAREGQATGEGGDASLRAELDALRRERAAEVAELDSIIAQIKPLIGEDNHA